jgi:cbb3-type cytochrome oxidase maturation protein
MMLSLSLTVILVVLVLVGLGLGIFFWAWRNGQFHNLDQQARVIFEERDYRLLRPWESSDQRAEREAQYGQLIDPGHGEWGGAE